MIDPGQIVIAIFVALVLLLVWSKRKPSRKDYPGGIKTRQPGEHQEGAHHPYGGE